MAGKRRGNGEGSIVRKPTGQWMAAMTIGCDPATGKLKRAYFYGKTRAEVSAKLAHAQSDKARGTFVEPHKVIVAQWLETWLEDYARPKVRQTTLDSYEGLIRRHLIPTLGRTPLQSLRSDMVQHVYNKKHSDGLSPGTIGMMHMVLSAAMKQAVRVGLVMRNPCEATTLPRVTTRTIHPLTLEEVRRLLSATRQDRLFPAMFLEFGTGLRRGELLAARWSDVDLDTGVLHVRQSLSRMLNRGNGTRVRHTCNFMNPRQIHRAGQFQYLSTSLKSYVIIGPDKPRNDCCWVRHTKITAWYSVSQTVARLTLARSRVASMPYFNKRGCRISIFTRPGMHTPPSPWS